MGKDDTSAAGGCLFGLMAITSVVLYVVLPWFGVTVSVWIFYAEVTFFAVLALLFVGLPKLLAKADEPVKADDGSPICEGKEAETSVPANSASQAGPENDQDGVKAATADSTKTANRRPKRKRQR